MNSTFDEMDKVVDTFFSAIDHMTESKEGTIMTSAREQLLDLAKTQNADVTIGYVACDDCNQPHTKVEVVLPDGYSWHSPRAGAYSGIGITSECRQRFSTVFAEVHSVIDYPVLPDIVHVGTV